MEVALEFQKWIDHLRRLNLPVVEMLQPGMKPQEIRRGVADIGLDCSEELVEFYSFCGGVRAPEGELLNHMWMYGSHFVLPFQRAVADYKLFVRDARWNRSWLPILGNDGGDFYALCALREDPNWNKTINFMIDTGFEPKVWFSSILNMLKVINKCFDLGACYLDKDGDLDTDFAAASNIAISENPGLTDYS